MYYEAMELKIHGETVIVYIQQYGEGIFTTNPSKGTCEYFTSPMSSTLGYLTDLLLEAERIEWIDEDFETADDLQMEVLEICDRGVEADHIKDLFARY